MKLINLQDMDGYTSDLFIPVSLRQFRKAKETDKTRIADFKEKWISQKASLKDWMQIGPIDIEEIIKGINKKELINLKDRQRRLYELWLNATLEFKKLHNFKKVLSRTPDQIKEFALHEILEIQKIIPELQTYSYNYDIHNQDRLKQDELIHYREFLKTFLKGIELPPIDKKSKYDEIMLENTFSEFLSFFTQLNVSLTYKENSYKDRTYRSWQINSINGASKATLRNKIQTLFEHGFQRLMNRIRSYSPEKIISVLDGLSEEMIYFRNSLFKREQYEYKDEDGERIKSTFKTISQVGFLGTGSFQIALSESNDSTFRYLLKELEPEIIIIEEVINNSIDKLNGVQNYVSLIKFSSKARLETSKADLSFKYIHKNHQHLTDFIEALRDAGFIDKGTSMSNAKKVFTGKEASIPVIWIRTIGELTVLVRLLSNLSCFEPFGNRLWEITCHCFILPGSILLTQQQLRKAKLPKNKSKIEALISLLPG
jgi:hypothetical protein